MPIKIVDKPAQKKYLKGGTLTQNNVYYFLVDAENQIVAHSGYGSGAYERGYSACFASLFQSVPKTAVATYIYHPTKKMGYDEKAITRYVSDLCEMGFTCEYLGASVEYSIFRIKFEDMETKNQYCSTLTLIRCLYEEGSKHVPEYYLQAMDKNPKGDKFLALQNAHKRCAYLGLGHNVTSKDNGADNIDLPLLFKRFKAEGKTPFSSGHTSLNVCWAGDEERYNKMKKNGGYYY